MRRSTGAIWLAALLAVTVPTSLHSEEPSAFDRIGRHYEAIRHALAQDSIEGVAEAAGRIRDELDALKSGGAQDSGVRDGVGQELLDVVTSLRTATEELQAASELSAARAAFGTLSKGMVRYRNLVPDPDSVVVFCSMAQQVWLQPRGDIGNPYYGKSMARCGEVVSN